MLRGAIWGSPAVANGVVYVGAFDDKVYAFDAATGAQLWTATTGNIIGSSPAVANGTLYIGSLDNSLYAYSLNGGNNSIYRSRRSAPAFSSSAHE